MSAEQCTYRMFSRDGRETVDYRTAFQYAAAVTPSMYTIQSKLLLLPTCYEIQIPNFRSTIQSEPEKRAFSMSAAGSDARSVDGDLLGSLLGSRLGERHRENTVLKGGLDVLALQEPWLASP